MPMPLVEAEEIAPAHPERLTVVDAFIREQAGA